MLELSTEVMSTRKFCSGLCGNRIKRKKKNGNFYIIKEKEVDRDEEKTISQSEMMEKMKQIEDEIIMIKNNTIINSMHTLIFAIQIPSIIDD